MLLLCANSTQTCAYVLLFRGIRDDIESEDIQEAFFRYMEENPMAGVIIEDDEIVEYDADGNAIIPEKKV